MSSLRKAVLSQAVRRMDRADVAYPVPAGLSATDFINALEHIIFTPADAPCVCQVLDFRSLADSGCFLSSKGQQSSIQEETTVTTLG